MGLSDVELEDSDSEIPDTIAPTPSGLNRKLDVADEDDYLIHDQGTGRSLSRSIGHFIFGFIVLIIELGKILIDYYII